MPISSQTLVGAIVGDVIGSVYEWNNIKTTDFDLYHPQCRYTDDTVLTLAVADALLQGKDFARTIWEYGNLYPESGYGGRFKQWLLSPDLLPYDSFGNGSAMRVGAVGFAFDDMQSVLQAAAQSAAVTHNHPEGIKGAQAVAAAVLLARQGKSKAAIKSYVVEAFGYNLDFSLDDIRPGYQFDVSCQGSVPQAIAAFLESTDFESALRLAISIGGDSDTIASIAGCIAHAHYRHIEQPLLDFVAERLPEAFLDLLLRFDRRYAPITPKP